MAEFFVLSFTSRNTVDMVVTTSDVEGRSVDETEVDLIWNNDDHVVPPDRLGGLFGGEPCLAGHVQYMTSVSKALVLVLSLQRER